MDGHRVDAWAPDAMFPESLDKPEQVSGLGSCGEIDAQLWKKSGMPGSLLSREVRAVVVAQVVGSALEKIVYSNGVSPSRG